MAFRFEIIGNGLTIEDTTKGDEIVLDHPAKACYYDTRELDAGRVVIRDLNLPKSDPGSMLFREDLSDCTDSLNVTYTATTFRAFANPGLAG